MRRALLVALALVLLVPVLAEGAMTPLRKTEGGGRPLSAQLSAKGSGVISVVGRMTVYGKIPSPGSVTVVDRAGDARVYVGGTPETFTDGALRVPDAQGILLVRGTDVSVQILGVDLKFSIAGSGTAQLRGSGTYRLNGGRERAWSRAWINVARSSAERRRSERCEGCSSSAAQRR